MATYDTLPKAIACSHNSGNSGSLKCSYALEWDIAAICAHFFGWHGWNHDSHLLRAFKMAFLQGCLTRRPICTYKHLFFT